METTNVQSAPKFKITGDVVFKGLMHFFRLMLGAWMVINGFNHWVPIFPQPFGGSPLSAQLIVTLYESGLFDVVKAAEIVGGILLIVNRFVPVGVVMLLPISAVVYFNATVLQGGWFRLYMGTGCFYFNVFLLFGYFKHYLPMLKADAEVGTLEDLKEIKGVLQSIIPVKK